MVAFPTFLPGAFFEPELDDFPEFTTEWYRLEEIRTENNAILFYVLDSLTINDAIGMLFDFYTKNPRPCGYCSKPDFKGWHQGKCPYCGKLP